MTGEGSTMSKKDFLSLGQYNKEPYEGLLVSSMAEGGYHIGVQINQDTVLKVDEADENSVREKLAQWTPRINEIQRQHGTAADLQNYDNIR